MAGDWIKVEMDTPDKPEMGFIARTCSTTTADTFIAWFRLWCWFDQQTDTGEVRFFSPDDADRIARLPGIGHALEGCGWITYHAGGASVTNWDRHNGSSAKKRAIECKRKADYREKKGIISPPQAAWRHPRPHSVP